jgi:hypothetical protein
MIRWIVWLCIALNLQTLAACSSSPRLPDVADKIGAASKLVVPMSRDALTLLGAERDRLVAANLLTGDAAAQVDAGLRTADATLVRVEKGEKVTREDLLKAIDSAALVNDLLIAAGAKPPPIVASAIEVARRVVDESE